MLTLIKREIEDNIAYFVGIIAASMLFTFAIIIMAFSKGFSEESAILIPSLYIPVIFFVFIGVCNIGVSQMYLDKSRKISAFLSTLPVSRNQILAARLITGILAILILLAAPFISFQALLDNFEWFQPAYKFIVFEITLTTFLLCLGVYSTGLMLGFNSNKVNSTLDNIALNACLITLIIIKGLGIEAQIILIVYIASCLIYTWRKFNTTALI
jgi:hypothetical protein